MNIDHLRKQAKKLKAIFGSLVAEHGASLSLRQAQETIARTHGYPSWSAALETNPPAPEPASPRATKSAPPRRVVPFNKNASGNKIIPVEDGAMPARFRKRGKSVWEIFLSLTWQDRTGRFLAIVASPRTACQLWQELYDRTGDIDDRFEDRCFRLTNVRAVDMDEIDVDMETRRGSGATPNRLELTNAAKQGYLFRYVKDD